MEPQTCHAPPQLCYCETKIRSTHCACKADVNRDGTATVYYFLYFLTYGSRLYVFPSCSLYSCAFNTISKTWSRWCEESFCRAGKQTKKKKKNTKKVGVSGSQPPFLQHPRKEDTAHVHTLCTMYSHSASLHPGDKEKAPTSKTRAATLLTTLRWPSFSLAC